MKTNTFDWSIKERFSEQLQYSKAFEFDDRLRKQFNLACVIQDRLHDALNYLDKHMEPPKTDRSLLLFMVYADNLFSAIQAFFTDVFKGEVENPFGDDNTRKENLKYFSTAFRTAFPKTSTDKIPTDDQFFRYFRALSLAHPYGTDRFKFIPKDEKHYSPFVLNNSNAGLRHGDGLIGIKVYSNKRDDFSIVFQFSVFMDFLISRYNTLRLITDHIQGIVDAKQREWAKHKVDRRKSCVGIWDEIHAIYVERHQDTDLIDEVVQHLKTPLSSGYSKNVKSVAKFRKAIESITFQVCDLVEKSDYEGVYNLIDVTISPKLPEDGQYVGVGYHIGKISEFCSRENHERQDYLDFDLPCLMDIFGSKWVEIDSEKMSRQEIWLLLSAAWYLEVEEYCCSNMNV